MTLVPLQALDWLVALLRDGRDYYRHAVEHTADAEIRHAFEISAEARDRLLADLRAVPPSEAAIAPSDASVNRRDVPEAQRYDLLRRQFDPQRATQQAQALVGREAATLRLAESVFRSHDSFAVRRLIKRHYPALRQAAAIIQRLARRSAAA